MKEGRKEQTTGRTQDARRQLTSRREANERMNEWPIREQHEGGGLSSCKLSPTQTRLFMNLIKSNENVETMRQVGIKKREEWTDLEQADDKKAA
ncbi:hypothetical protein WR25_25521 [Diploscapter pachys]|uniref:Uncharacterized protein n=1 Tax=Diploscapter pachys TaxID=2018661 RepID=A0A2A2JG12_9BILA|nr:hypothetical protein WR25_25521 [Diploscapter pachys]